MNKRELDKMIKKQFVKHIQSKQRAEFEAPKTRMSHMMEPPLEFADKIAIIEKKIIPSKELQRLTFDKPAMIRLFSICNYLDCS